MLATLRSGSWGAQGSHGEGPHVRLLGLPNSCSRPETPYQLPWDSPCYHSSSSPCHPCRPIIRPAVIPHPLQHSPWTHVQPGSSRLPPSWPRWGGWGHLGPCGPGAVADPWIHPVTMSRLPSLGLPRLFPSAFPAPSLHLPGSFPRPAPLPPSAWG